MKPKKPKHHYGEFAGAPYESYYQVITPGLELPKTGYLQAVRPWHGGGSFLTRGIR
jgi:hypothetical protein